MKKLEDYTLKELRGMYPQFKSTSKKKFIEKVLNEEVMNIETDAEELRGSSTNLYVSGIEAEVIPDEVQYEVDMFYENYPSEFIKYNRDAGRKYLVVVKDKDEVEKVYQEAVVYLSELAKLESVPFMAESGSYQLHYAGKTFFRVVCINKKEHALNISKFTDIIEL